MLDCQSVLIERVASAIFAINVKARQRIGKRQASPHKYSNFCYNRRTGYSKE